jgi:hypothetical protein
MVESDPSSLHLHSALQLDQGSAENIFSAISFLEKKEHLG